jgi:hypothetical protein
VAAVDGYKNEIKKMRRFMLELNKFATGMSAAIDEATDDVEILKISVVQVLEWVNQTAALERFYREGGEDDGEEDVDMEPTSPSSIQEIIKAAFNPSPSAGSGSENSSAHKAPSKSTRAPLAIEYSSGDEMPQPLVEVNVISATPGTSQEAVTAAGLLVEGAEGQELSQGGEREYADAQKAIDGEGEGEEPADGDADGEEARNGEMDAVEAADGDADGEEAGNGETDAVEAAHGDSDAIEAAHGAADTEEDAVEADAEAEGDGEEASDQDEAVPPIAPVEETPTETKLQPPPFIERRCSPRLNVARSPNMPKDEMPVIVVKRKMVEEDGPKKKAKK